MINKSALPYDHINRVIDKVTSNGVECAGLKLIVATEPTDNISSTARKALIDCIRLTGILFRNPPVNPMRKFPNQVDAAVARPAVDDDNLEPLILLVN